MNSQKKSLSKTLSGVAQGFEPLAIQALWAHLDDQTTNTSRHPLIYITSSQERAYQLTQQLMIVLRSKAKILSLPEWDCLPYDRVSPSQDVLSERMNTLISILYEQNPTQPLILVASCNSALQRIAPKPHMEGQTLTLATSSKISFAQLSIYLSDKGYLRTDTVREAGEFAIRGDIVDIYPVGEENPIRLDFFGDEIESMRIFDPLTQTSIGKASSITLKPSSEICLSPDAINTFRRKYREQFGSAMTPLYESISQGRRYIGMEHWLPLFFDAPQTVFDYLPNALILMDFQADDAVRTRLELLQDYYHNRTQRLTGDKSPAFNPVKPAQLCLTQAEWDALKYSPNRILVTPFSPETESPETQDFGCRSLLLFDKLPADTQGDAPHDLNNLEKLKAAFVTRKDPQKKPIILTALSEGSKDRLMTLLEEHGLNTVKSIEEWPSFEMKDSLLLLTYPLERGFESPNFILITEQDLLGEKMIRQPGKKRQVKKLLLETNQLVTGDLVVHRDHGVGQYQGLSALQIGSAFHDCLCLLYEGGDKLFLPVENIEAISRYGSEGATAQLDKLGAIGWQNRKARVKKRIKEIADYLIKLAAERALHRGEIFETTIPSYDDFCARFPYVETDDQLRAIAETLEDMSSGKPMDRLICGDVGFGKTEVALRAAFIAAANGKQVAIVTPTTLLCRQHFKTFTDRFANTGYRVEQLSRLVTPTQSGKIRHDLADGKVDIIIATHTLFSDKAKFADLGLVIIDEEQHFGVKQKEKLKSLQSDVHVLTLTATPIPRTLQMALTGVREMSIIATPPIDRLAVRTFVTPYDSLIIREAILREHYRGGQVFFVCPRLDDLVQLEKDLALLIPEIKLITAHGQMPTTQLENVMTAFYDRQYDLLLSTNIVESGIDIASANTLIIHRSDLFGLAQLYQLRGRVGRSKAQSYAYLTMPANKPISETAQRRLEIMQTLDKLGAGFTLASHDMDIRGTGNLVGEEQSGHIREVGVELYQHLLQEAILMVRAEQELGIHVDRDWSPQINLGTSVMIPETYVADLNLRLSLYRRAANLQNRNEIDGFAAEMIDRFGKLPPEVRNLFEIIEIKSYCRQASIEKVDAGPKGLVITFRNNTFANPLTLLEHIQNPKTAAKMRPDQKVVFMREWDNLDQRVRSSKIICRNLAKLAIG